MPSHKDIVPQHLTCPEKDPPQVTSVSWVVILQFLTLYDKQPNFQSIYGINDETDEDIYKRIP